MNCHWRIIDNSWKYSLEAQIASNCYGRKFYCDRHLWWMHSWLDLIRKFSLIVDQKRGLLRSPHGDIPLLATETIAVLQVHSEVDPIREVVKSCKEILSWGWKLAQEELIRLWEINYILHQTEWRPALTFDQQSRIFCCATQLAGKDISQSCNKTGMELMWS